jgi:hypothetical protein
MPFFAQIIILERMAMICLDRLLIHVEIQNYSSFHILKANTKFHSILLKQSSFCE